MQRISALFLLVPSALALPLILGDGALSFGAVRDLESDESATITSQIVRVEAAERSTDTQIVIAQLPFTSGTITVSKNLARQAAERQNGGLENYRAEPAMHGPALDAPYRDGGDTWIFTFRGGAPGESFTVESEIAINKTSLAIDILYNGPLRTARTQNNRPQTSQPRNNQSRNNQSRNGNAGGQGRNLDETARQPSARGEPQVPDPVTPDPRDAGRPDEQQQDQPQQDLQGQPSAEPIASGSAELSDNASADNQPSPDRVSNRPAPSRSLSAPGDITTAKNFARQAAERANGGLNNYSAESSMHGPALESPFRDDGDRWIFTFRGGFPGDISLPIESEVAVNKSTFETTVLYNGPLRDESLQ
ncbi:MAG: hypothetical protein AB4050_03840 [Synechococcus sp.]